MVSGLQDYTDSYQNFSEVLGRSPRPPSIRAEFRAIYPDSWTSFSMAKPSNEFPKVLPDVQTIRCPIV